MMKRGFTLIEAVVVIALSVMALLALVNLFLVFSTTYGYQQAFMATAGSTGTAMQALEAAILPAEEVLASRSFSGTEYASATTTLVLKLPAIDNSGNIILGVKDYVVFYASSTVLYRLIEADASSARSSGLKQLSAALSEISFTYDDSNLTEVTSVTVDLEAQAQFKGQMVESRLREQMYLRNISPL